MILTYKKLDVQQYRTQNNEWMVEALTEPLPGNFSLNEKGLHYLKPYGKNETDQDDSIWVCAPIRVAAITRNPIGEGYGKVVEFLDSDGELKEVILPSSDMSGDGKEIRARLMDLGLQVAYGTKAKSALLRFLIESVPKARARSVNVIGWQGTHCFILPTGPIGGSNDERVIYQSQGSVKPGFGTAGTLEDWRDQVSSLCRGNSRLIFSVSLSFAAPLIHLLGDENGGFHFRGSSTTGKTTAINVAGSVWGGKPYLQRWRATANGLEGMAFAHNDCPLCLDEMGEMNPKELSEVIYMLANGMGKGRAAKSGFARQRASWRVLFLSSGEISLAQHMATANKEAKAGHHIRLIEIPADSGVYGLFEEIHGIGHETGKEFSEHINSASFQFFGSAGPAFLRELVKEPSHLDFVKQKRRDFLRQAPAGASSQAGRVLNRFALVAAAGELSTRMGLTGWRDGEAFEAARKCFDAWHQERGGLGIYEEQEAISTVCRFFQEYGNSRFEEGWQETQTRFVNKRAGYRKATDVPEDPMFYVFPEVFKNEICSGKDHLLVAKLCITHGLLIPESTGNSTRSERVPALNKKQRMYVFRAKVLVDHSNLSETSEAPETDNLSPYKESEEAEEFRIAILEADET